LQGTVITQMIDGTSSLLDTVLQMYYAIFLNISLNLTKLLQKYTGPVFVATVYISAVELYYPAEILCSHEVR